MINSLFSIFDPSSSYLNLIQLFRVFLLIIIFNNAKKSTSNNKQATLKGIGYLTKETGFLLVTKHGNKIMTVSILVILITLNVLTIFPQIFANTSKITLTLVIALTF